MLIKIKNYFKSLSAFKRVLWIYCSALTVIMIALLCVLWTFLASYQSSLPRYFAESYVKKLDSDDIIELYKEALEESCVYETPQEASEALASILTKDGVIRARKDSSLSTDDAPVFNMLCGKNNIGKLYLTRAKNGAYGFERWKLEKLTANADTIELLALQRTFTVPADAILYINGVKVNSDKAIAATDPFISPLEKQSSLSFVAYEIVMPYSSDEVTVTYGADSLSAAGDNYDYPVGTRKELTVYAPSTASVYINKLMLPASYILEKDIMYPNATELDKANGAAPLLNSYKVTSLTAVPEITVVYNGHELSGEAEGNTVTYLADDVIPKDYTLYAPAGAVISVNGVVVAEKYAVSQGSVFHEVKKYADLLVKPVLNVEYRFEGLISKPTFSVTLNGEAVAITDSGDGVLQCKLMPDDEAIEDYELLALDFTHSIMNYMYGGREVIGETISEVLGCTKHGSDAYNKIQDTYSGMFYRPQMDITYNELYVDSYAVYADNAFYCEVHYDVFASNPTINRTDAAKGVYKLVYINENGNWLLYDVVLY